MEIDSLKSISIDELWSLHEQVTSTLVRRIAEEKAKLEERLRRLAYADGAIGLDERATSLNRRRRPYPKVLPKYQNPRNPAERWSGRGSNRIGYECSSRLARSLSIFSLLDPQICHSGLKRKLTSSHRLAFPSKCGRAFALSTPVQCGP